MSLMKDVKGTDTLFISQCVSSSHKFTDFIHAFKGNTDMEANEQKEHRQRQAKQNTANSSGRAYPTAGKRKERSQQQEKSIPNSREKKRAFPTAGKIE